MAHIKSVFEHLTIPAGFHPAIVQDISLPVRQVVEIPDEALDAVLALGGICVLPDPDPDPDHDHDPEPEALVEAPEPVTHFDFSERTAPEPED